jgi:hypothetical protein
MSKTQNGTLVIWWVLVGFCLVPSLGMAGALGKITLQDGSQVHGEIVSMTEGVLKVKTLFHKGEDPLTIKWSEVTGIDTKEPLTFHLRNGTTLDGLAVMTEPGKLNVTTESFLYPIPVPVESIVAVNPPGKKAVTVTGNLDFGGSITTGNTDLQTFSLVGEIIAKTEQTRSSLVGRYLYGESEGELIARNAFGTIKFDYFVDKRFYLYTGALFEQDTFQAIQLRTSAFAGPGYQIIEEGDYTSPFLKKMKLHGEIGVGYFYEDRRQAENTSRATGRWSANFTWTVVPWLTLFHQHQTFPSLHNVSEWYVTSQQGIRMKTWGNLQTTFQVNWRYDNRPAPDTRKADTQYILAIGYAFES